MGEAITLPVGGRRVLILYKSESPTAATMHHELCHVRQYERMGLVRYYLAHLWARVRTMNLLARNQPIEAECYKAEKE